ncbi:hypothetical protein HNP84_007300 [Thermocatellispora tengchongensis]|uniref:Uncharacterized protein n=1 Tax=Thermocatellispora tengchongensis TaxID=1073253 RepID=A0A840PD61_9ACTN|nr:hypothetical protein [Thermocatellispora tengchongensis]MBB5137548.1 hypothetical protein [Thermocatellispora tengchongensis]
MALLPNSLHGIGLDHELGVDETSLPRAQCRHCQLDIIEIRPDVWRSDTGDVREDRIKCTAAPAPDQHHAPRRRDRT